MAKKSIRQIAKEFKSKKSAPEGSKAEEAGESTAEEANEGPADPKSRFGGTAKKETPAQSAKVGKTMGEFKSGDLHSGSDMGPIVKSKKQALAISMSQAGLSKK